MGNRANLALIRQSYVHSLKRSGLLLHCCLWLVFHPFSEKLTFITCSIVTNSDLDFSKGYLDSGLHGGSFYLKGTFLK